MPTEHAFSGKSKPARTADHIDQANHGSNEVYPLGQSFHAVELRLV